VAHADRRDRKVVEAGETRLVVKVESHLTAHVSQSLAGHIRMRCIPTQRSASCPSTPQKGPRQRIADLFNSAIMLLAACATYHRIAGTLKT
jgi:hypothetical protein